MSRHGRIATPALNVDVRTPVWQYIDEMAGWMTFNEGLRAAALRHRTAHAATLSQDGETTEYRVDDERLLDDTGVDINTKTPHRVDRYDITVLSRGEYQELDVQSTT